MILLFSSAFCGLFQRPETVTSEGSPVPPMSFPADNGDTVSTSDMIGKWTVLYFYPRDDTPGCTTEAINFTILLEEYHASGAQVFGINTDSPESHRNFKKKHKLGVTLLTDTGMQASKEFGIRVIAGMCARDSVLINPEGRVEKFYRGVNPAGSPAEILKYIQSK